MLTVGMEISFIHDGELVKGNIVSGDGGDWWNVESINPTEKVRFISAYLHISSIVV